MGAALGLAINSPKDFKKMVERRALDRRVQARGGSAEDGDDIVELFRSHGIRVIDKTQG